MRIVSQVAGCLAGDRRTHFRRLDLRVERADGARREGPRQRDADHRRRRIVRRGSVGRRRTKRRHGRVCIRQPRRRPHVHGACSRQPHRRRRAAERRTTAARRARLSPRPRAGRRHRVDDQGAQRHDASYAGAAQTAAAARFRRQGRWCPVPTRRGIEAGKRSPSNRAAASMPYSTFHRALGEGDAQMSMPMSHHDHASADKPDGVAMAQQSKLAYLASPRWKLPSLADTSPAASATAARRRSSAAPADIDLRRRGGHVYPGNLRDMAFALSRDGGRTFAPPVRVSEDKWMLEGCPDDGPAMAVDARQRDTTSCGRRSCSGATADAEPTIALFYAMSSDGKRFTARERIPTEGMPHHPRVTIGADGSLIAAWTNSRTVRDEWLSTASRSRTKPPAIPSRSNRRKRTGNVSRACHLGRRGRRRLDRRSIRVIVHSRGAIGGVAHISHGPMSLIRARLIVCAFALLLCQSAALASAPIALFRGAMFGDADECCRNLKPGQMCPMHHRTHDSSVRSGAGMEVSLCAVRRRADLARPHVRHAIRIRACRIRSRVPLSSPSSSRRH